MGQEKQEYGQKGQKRGQARQAGQQRRGKRGNRRRNRKPSRAMYKLADLLPAEDIAKLQAVTTFKRGYNK
ncbi:hypothetical protein QNH47_06230 [Virgibacillus halodenitrificans]|uniref:hypothetical protein n=1 Tax=Virgibacillus halodenitrificans TaxID=1482 RepID=UPI0024BF3183|nr:hypothetical protein [Virgibacillus halodenitrificans]WHX27450.1 hypothetical protein QNH47_06230 [Virgibacillus halodenitrificans]